jgi:hypothetical protein
MKATKAMIARATRVDGTAMAAIMPGVKGWEEGDDGDGEGSERGELDGGEGVEEDRATDARP